MARRHFPDLAAQEGLPMDIHGDDIASSDSDPGEPSSSDMALADRRQTVALSLARTILLHAAKLRVLYPKYQTIRAKKKPRRKCRRSCHGLNQMTCTEKAL